MTEPLNVYGDRIVRTSGKHGADISGQRLDELDSECLLHALRLPKREGLVVDLGCGLGMQGLRLAVLGFDTLLIDRIPIEQTVMKIAGLTNIASIAYLEKDACRLRETDFNGEVLLCYSQRFIHYLKFADALSLLRLIRSKMRAGAELFLSASGIGSELGNDYRGKTQALADRFAALSPEMADKHDIHAPICLYSPEELVELCGKASFAVERIFTSRFGNVKGIFTAI